MWHWLDSNDSLRVQQRLKDKWHLPRKVNSSSPIIIAWKSRPFWLQQKKLGKTDFPILHIRPSCVAQCPLPKKTEKNPKNSSLSFLWVGAGGCFVKLFSKMENILLGVCLAVKINFLFSKIKDYFKILTLFGHCSLKTIFKNKNNKNNFHRFLKIKRKHRYISPCFY